MYEALLKNTPEYQKVAASLTSPGPAALFGLPPAGRALLYASLQKDTGRVLCIVTPGEAEATHFAEYTGSASGMDHTTYAHTGASVNIYALGVGAEKFRGVFDNTEIYHKLAELTGVQ